MRTFRTLAALIALSAAVPSLAADPPKAPDPSREAVWKTIDGFNRAFAANDPETYFRFIDDDIVVLTPSNPYRIEGIRDDREEFEFGLRQGYGRIGYFQELQPRIDVFGDVAVVTYFSRGSYGAGDKSTTLYLKETDVLVRRGDAWKIVHIHVSATGN